MNNGRTGLPSTGFAVLCALLLQLAGCSEADREPSSVVISSQSEAPAAQLELDRQTSASIRLLVASYLQQAQSDLGQADQSLIQLAAAIDALLQAPSRDSLSQARQAWLTAHNGWEARLLHQYFADQVLDGEQALQLTALEYSINQWPILPGYVDAVANYPDSGIVNDMTVPLSPENLRQIHGEFDLAEAALGFHVLEYLLWGENSATGPMRTAAAFTASTALSDEQLADGLSVEQLPNNRRRRLLAMVMDILYQDFQRSREIWSLGIVAYEQQLANQSGALLLNQLLSAINSMLSEEFLVRSLYPMLNGNYQESIHSPYSHSTQNAVVAQIASLEHLLLQATTADGTRLDDLLSGLSADFEELFYQNLDASKECLVLLYSDIRQPASPEAAMDAEFRVVECINLLTNLIDHLEQVQQGLAGFP